MLSRHNLTFEELNSKFDSFEIDDRKCEHFLTACKELKEMLDSVLDNYKSELLGDTSYELLVTSGTKIQEYFGSLKKIPVIFLLNIFIVFK